MKNTTIFGLIVTVIVIIAAFLLIGGGVHGPTGDVTDQGSNEVQRIVLSVKDFNYYPQVIHVKAGQPVSLSLDSSVSGCLRTFTIPDLNIAKSLPTPQDSVDFTPAVKGTYKFQCSMGMGFGTMIVE